MTLMRNDSRGRVTGETSANGTMTVMAYSADDRVTTITNVDGDTEMTALNADGMRPACSYDANGRLLQRTWAQGVVTTYAYDGWGNLTNTVYSDGTPSVSLTYDSFGRKTVVADAAGTTALKIDCSEVVRNGEVFYMLGEADRDELENEAHRKTGAHKLAYDRYYESYKENLNCGIIPA